LLRKDLRIVYLHGFASSPASRKAQYFSERLAETHHRLEVPALDEGDFEHLTIGGQLDLLKQLLAGDPTILIGSSLGGYVAALYAARHPEVERLVLLAPAFKFFDLWTDQVGPDGLDRWRSQGVLPVFHYAAGRELPLAYSFYQDASRFEPFPDFRQPALIFHGNQDASVPVQYSTMFAEQHPNARLVRLDSGHELTDALETIWRETKPFLWNRLLASEC
jgi:pimeloyl-ACP methyl ester carboxylesterase